MDNSEIIQEVVNSFNKSTRVKVSFMIKIDLEKAHNKLEWSFILRTLF